MSRASRWAARQTEEIQVDRPRFESPTVEAWVTDKGELAIWHKAVLGAKDAAMTLPETALALADWIDAIFCPDALDGIVWVPLDETPTVARLGEPIHTGEDSAPVRQAHLEEVGGQMRWVA